MTNPVILLSHSNSTRNATRKIFETLYIDSPFLVRNLPEAPAKIDVNELIVSEAMKLACNNDERVLILGVDKDDVIAAIGDGSSAELTVAGKLKTGQCIYGSDTVRTVRPRRRARRPRRRR